jgi:choline dehydrogenase
MMQADFVIIGSGSAGSAMAYRLSEDGKNSVIVIEAGGTDFGPFIQMPGALAWPMSMKRYNWGYLSEPEPNLNNRRITAPRGKVIGGSSSINGLVYVRGHAEDYNRWEELGATGLGLCGRAALFQAHGAFAMAAKKAGAARTGLCM